MIGAFPGARGTVADLGGGSLELVMIEDGDCHDGVSLPLGTLRLPALREKGAASFGKAVEREMAGPAGPPRIPARCTWSAEPGARWRPTRCAAATTR